MQDTLDRAHTMGYYWEGGSHSKCSYDVVWQLWMFRPMSCYRNGERQMLSIRYLTVKLQKVLAAAANRHTHLWNGISWWKIDLFVMLHTATYAASPCHLTPPRPATPPYPPPQHEDPIIVVGRLEKAHNNWLYSRSLESAIYYYISIKNVRLYNWYIDSLRSFTLYWLPCAITHHSLYMWASRQMYVHYRRNAIWERAPQVTPITTHCTP